MKKLLCCIFLIIAYYTFCQNFFEGSIQYKATVLGEDSEIIKSFLPESYTFNFKGKDIRMNMKGGIAESVMGDVISKGDSGFIYLINKNEHVVRKLIPEKFREEINKMNLSTTKLEDSKVILGHKCILYKITSIINGEKNEQLLWVTHDIRVEESMNNDFPGIINFVVSSIDGIALEVISNLSVHGMKFSMKMIATGIEELKLSDQLFEIPPGYKIEEIDRNTYKF